MKKQQMRQQDALEIYPPPQHVDKLYSNNAVDHPPI